MGQTLFTRMSYKNLRYPLASPTSVYLPRHRPRLPKTPRSLTPDDATNTRHASLALLGRYTTVKHIFTLAIIHSPQDE